MNDTQLENKIQNETSNNSYESNTTINNENIDYVAEGTNTGCLNSDVNIEKSTGSNVIKITIGSSNDEIPYGEGSSTIGTEHIHTTSTSENIQPTAETQPVESTVSTHSNVVKTESTSSVHSIKNEKTSSVTDLQKIVQKLEKLEKMINPNSKKSLILWEEDNSFKNLISSIVSYSTTCDTTEFPIELLDRLKALATDVDNQIAEGAVKVEELTKQAKINTELSEILSTVYISAMAGNPIEEYESKIQNPEISSYREHLVTISTAVPESEEYLKAEKAIKSKITNLENSVHITIDLERTTSKGGALQYIKTEVAPAVERLQAAYDEQYKVSEVTEINGEEAIMALAVRKTFSEKVYDTFVRPFANFFKRRSKAK